MLDTHTTIYMLIVGLCLGLSKRNCFIIQNFSSFMHLLYVRLPLPYIILSLLFSCVCEWVCVYMCASVVCAIHQYFWASFTVNYILSNYLCKSFNFYKRVLATQKSRLVSRLLLLLFLQVFLFFVVFYFFFLRKITLKAWHEVAARTLISHTVRAVALASSHS